MMKHTLSLSAQRLAVIDMARRVVFQDRATLPSGWVAPWVERSWQRCLTRGRQPQEGLNFNALPDAQRRRTLEAHRPLVQAARPLLDKLARTLSNTRYFVILTNADGVVVDVRGEIEHTDPRAHLITRIGVDLSERSIGTAAIGMALHELQPVWLHRGEHFFNETSHYSCAGAPVFGPDGCCLGMLDVTGIDTLERPELKHLVAHYASQIENALLLSQAHRLMVRLNWPGSPLGSDADGLLCLDADGLVTGANPHARQMLPPLNAAGQSPTHVSDLFGIPPELLFDTARRQNATLEVPLWTGLVLQVMPVERRHADRPVLPTPRAQTSAPRQLKDIELALIHQAVERARGNVTVAAQALGISRATVYRKLGQRPGSV